MVFDLVANHRTGINSSNSLSLSKNEGSKIKVSCCETELPASFERVKAGRLIAKIKQLRIYVYMYYVLCMCVYLCLCMHVHVSSSLPFLKHSSVPH